MKTFKSLVVPFISVLAIAGLAGCASTSKSEGTGEYVDDSVITAKVKTAIFEQPTLKSAEINVETFKGKVQLSGFVASADSANLAVATAKGVKGVDSVKNDMRVK
jgi:hyperosmotically inducible protein